MELLSLGFSGSEMDPAVLKTDVAGKSEKNSESPGMFESLLDTEIQEAEDSELLWPFLMMQPLLKLL